MDLQYFIIAFTSIISILNPIGAIPVFVSLTES
ncbi:MarC family protein, partial [Methanocaldococcus villosus]